jgi:hypothetical protein
MYLVNPPPSELQRAVDQILSEPVAQRRWERKNVPGGIAARIGTFEGSVINISYGGLCFETLMGREEEAPLPISFDVSFLHENISVAARRVWLKPGELRETLRYGAAVVDAESPVWRGVVDRVGGTA